MIIYIHQNINVYIYPMQQLILVHGYQGTSAVEGMFLSFTREDHVALSTNDPFINMDKLRLLKIWKVKFSGDIKYLSNELRFIEWHECPLRSLPSNFQADKLGELYLYSSRIEQLWSGEKVRSLQTLSYSMLLNSDHN